MKNLKLIKKVTKFLLRALLDRHSYEDKKKVLSTEDDEQKVQTKFLEINGTLKDNFKAFKKVKKKE